MDYEIQKSGSGGPWQKLSLDQLSKESFENHLAEATDGGSFWYYAKLSGVICLDVKKELCQVGQDIVYSATDVFNPDDHYYIKAC